MSNSDQLQKLDKEFNKETLQKHWLPLVKNFYSSNPKKTWKNISSDYIHFGIVNKTAKSKATLLDICFSVLDHKEIYFDFISSLPDYLSAIINKLIWQDYLSKDEVEKLYNGPVLTKKAFQYNYLPTEPFGIFEFNVISSGFMIYAAKNLDVDKSINYSIKLNDVLVDLIRNYYPQPEGYDLTPYQLDESQDGLKIYKSEAYVHAEVPKVIGYLSQGNLKFNDKGKPNQSSLPKMQKALGLHEFFDEKELNTRKTMMLAGVLNSYQISNMAVNGIDVISGIFNYTYSEEEFSTLEFHPVYYLLTKIKGINYVQFYDLRAAIHTAIRLALDEFPLDEWVSVENLLTYFQLRRIDGSPFESTTISHRLSYEIPSSRNVYTNQQQIRKHEVRQLISTPYIKANLFLLASLGILDLAYRETDITKEFNKDWCSEYDGVIAARLTGLGSYLIGRTKKYAAPETKPNKLIFDENSLIVRAEGNLDLIKTILGNYVTKVSNNRYSFNTGYFLADCKTQKDIINKISSFKKLIATKLPTFWQNYLDSLVSNASLIQLKEEYLVYELPPTNKELHQLFVTDPELKELCLKAEKFKIIVSKNYLYVFTRRLKDLGYVIGASVVEKVAARVGPGRRKFIR